mmetsp:Transcript_21131/g.34955  ORF Transcript_21131/g.34955 Transcript_21131/m.34955 type:complete len:204 (-) Transcript_21131:964-1575(-)
MHALRAYDYNEWAAKTALFLRQNEKLLNSSVLEFCTHNAFDLVNPEWREVLCQLNIQDLRRVPLCVLPDDEAPVSLIRHLEKARELQLDRTPIDLKNKSSMSEFTPVDTQHIPSWFFKGMNVKKQHEVQKSLELVTHVAKTSGATLVIDIGAGQGYVDFALALFGDLAVIACEASAIRTDRLKGKWASLVSDAASKVAWRRVF